MAHVCTIPGAATRLPLELKLLIVQVLFESQSRLRDRAISSIALVWPETLSSIRRHRFTEIKMNAAHPCPENFLQIIHGAPGIGELVRKIVPLCFPSYDDDSEEESYYDSDNDAGSHSPMSYPYCSPSLAHLLSCLENLEEMTVKNFQPDQMHETHREELFGTLRRHLSLRTVTLEHFRANNVYVLNTFLLSLPRLQTLNISESHISQLRSIASEYITDSDDARVIDWESYDAPTLGPFESVTDMTFKLSTASDSAFVDLIGATTSVFPNAKKLTFRSNYPSSYALDHFIHFLKALHSCLLFLDIDDVFLCASLAGRSSTR